jgi:hypothetical protein
MYIKVVRLAQTNGLGAPEYIDVIENYVWTSDSLIRGELCLTRRWRYLQRSSYDKIGERFVWVSQSIISFLSMFWKAL